MLSAGVVFTEVRVNRASKVWKKMKEAGVCPYGQLPLLTFGEKEDPSKLQVLAQSGAINRVSAERAGLMDPSDPLRYAKIDEVLCALQEIRNKFLPSILE